jgi:hypothetical protein
METGWKCDELARLSRISMTAVAVACGALRVHLLISQAAIAQFFQR